MSESIPLIASEPPAGIMAASVVEIAQWNYVMNRGLKYVYVLQCAETLRLKIGVADDWERRLKEIQAMSPTKLDLVFCFIAEGVELETWLHQKFAAYRLHGEWFTAAPKVVDVLNRLRQERDDHEKMQEEAEVKEIA